LAFRSRQRAFLGTWFISALLATACHDVESDPLAVAVAPEAHGAVLVAPELPDIPTLLAREGLNGSGGSEAMDWLQSWEVSGAEGDALRNSLYRSVTSQLFPRLGEEGVLELLSQNKASLSAAESATALLVSEAIQSAVDEAWRLHDWAERAFLEGDSRRALERVLRSGDALRKVGPKQVASALVDRADRALRRSQEPPPYSEEELARIRRLLNGAREALREGDYPLAIRRAYYSCQLLGAGPN
jgi:hypothetical protein